MLKKNLADFIVYEGRRSLKYEEFLKAAEKD